MTYTDNCFLHFAQVLGFFFFGLGFLGGLMPTMQWQRFILPLFFSECCSSSQSSARKHTPRRWHASRSCTTGVFSGIQKNCDYRNFRIENPPLYCLQVCRKGLVLNYVSLYGAILKSLFPTKVNRWKGRDLSDWQVFLLWNITAQLI